MNMPEPGPQHQRLSAFAGHFVAEETMYPSQWSPEQKQAKASVTSKVALGGFFVITDYEQRIDERVTFRGHCVYGYDAMSDRYTMHWFDSMGFDPGAPALGIWDGNVLTFTSAKPHSTGRYTYTFHDDGSYSFRMENGPSEQELKPVMDAVYRPA